MKRRAIELLTALAACLAGGVIAMAAAAPAVPIAPASQPEANSTPAATSRPDAAGVSAPLRAGLVPLQLKLPKPVFASTPKNIPPGTTVEKPTGRPRPPLMVPPGLTNLALGKPVASSDADPVIGELKFVTDGNKEAADGGFVELGPGLQHVQIDLGRSADIVAVVVWHNHGDPRVYHDVIVQASDDPAFAKDVKTLFNNDHDNSAGLGAGTDREYFETFEGKLISAGRVKARYLRLYSKGSTASEMNHYTEVEVYGR